ncbi:MAG: L,D-transpeptidase [Chthoniobacteraceae bacterium]
MKHLLTTFCAVAAIVVLSGCSGNMIGGSYSVKAYAPHNPSAVRVKVSTSTQNIYVMEGSRVLMAVQGCVGANGATGSGHYSIIEKIKDKRRASAPDVGYPMAYWCSWKSAYGFHEGFVHPRPRTHGCIRMHREAAARFYALVRIGTPVDIASSQPEDATVGRTVRQLDQSRDPDPPRSFMLSSAWFKDPAGPLLIKE